MKIVGFSIYISVLPTSSKASKNDQYLPKLESLNKTSSQAISLDVLGNTGFPMFPVI